MTSASRFETTKVSSATSGSLTIGWPFRLKDVFKRTGKPVSSSNCLSNAQKRGFSLLSTVWSRGRSIHMSDRAQLVAVLGPRLRDEQHVRVVALLPFRDLEILVRGLGHHRGSERPELLALLDQLVDVVSHLRVTRVA